MVFLASRALTIYIYRGRISSALSMSTSSSVGSTRIVTDVGLLDEGIALSGVTLFWFVLSTP